MMEDQQRESGSRLCCCLQQPPRARRRTRGADELYCLGDESGHENIARFEEQEDCDQDEEHKKVTNRSRSSRIVEEDSIITNQIDYNRQTRTKRRRRSCVPMSSPSSESSMRRERNSSDPRGIILAKHCHTNVIAALLILFYLLLLLISSELQHHQQKPGLFVSCTSHHQVLTNRDGSLPGFASFGDQIDHHRLSRDDSPSLNSRPRLLPTFWLDEQRQQADDKVVDVASLPVNSARRRQVKDQLVTTTTTTSADVNATTSNNNNVAAAVRRPTTTTKQRRKSTQVMENELEEVDKRNSVSFSSNKLRSNNDFSSSNNNDSTRATQTNDSECDSNGDPIQQRPAHCNTDETDRLSIELNAGRRPARRKKRHAPPLAQPGSSSRDQKSSSPPPQQNSNQQQKKPTVMSAILRGQVVLECNLEPPDSDDEVSLVLWYKDNSMVPIYSVDARAAPVQLARHKPGAWLEGRSRLKITTATNSIPPNSTPGRSLRRRHIAGGTNNENNDNNSSADDLASDAKLLAEDLEDPDDEAEEEEPPKSTAQLYSRPDEENASKLDRLPSNKQQLSSISSHSWLHNNNNNKRHLHHSTLVQNPYRRTAAAAPTARIIPQQLDQKSDRHDSLETWPPTTTLSGAGSGGATNNNNNLDVHRRGRRRRPEMSLSTKTRSGLAAATAIKTKTGNKDEQEVHYEAERRKRRHFLFEQDGQSEVLLPQPEARVGVPSDGDDGATNTNRQHMMMAQLTIDSLSSEDNGLYKCRVDFRRARSRIEESELRIIVPADKPVIRDLSNSILASGELEPPVLGGQHPATPTTNMSPHQLAAAATVGPHNEGARLLLECETSGGYPEPSLTWWRDGRLVDGSFEIVSASDGQVLEQRQVSEQNLSASAASLSNIQDGLNGAENNSEESNSPPVDDLDAAAANRHHHHHHQNHNHHHHTRSSQESAPESTAAATDGDSSASSSSATATTSAAKSTRQVQNRLIRNRLEIGALSRADLLANYSCLAWNSKLGEPPSSFVMIDMNLRPLKVQIDNERQPVLADKQLEIVCRAFGSRPAPLISWFRGPTKLKPTSSTTTGRTDDEHNGEDDANQLQKRGRRNNGVNNFVSIQESISADTNVTTSILTIVPNLADANQLITCRAENTFITGQQQQQHGINPADNSPPLPTMIEDSWKLEVHHLPQVKLALGEKLFGRQVHEGQDVYFECSVLAQPRAHELRWWFNGKELETNVSQGVIISNQSLVLQRVSRRQRGRYTCSAINSVGESQSNVLQLRIQHAPYCRDHSTATTTNSNEGEHSAAASTPVKTHYGTARMEPIKVHCHVDADPSTDSSLTYKWAFVAQNQSPLAATNSSASSTAPSQQQQQYFWSGQQLVYLPAELQDPPDPRNALTGSLTYTPKSELDYGTLLCWAQNSLGWQQEPCVYQIVPAERPESVRNCRLLNATGAQLAVACEPGYDGGIDQTFHMEVYESGRRPVGGGGAMLVANVTNSPGLTTSQLLLLSANELDEGGAPEGNTSATVIGQSDFLAGDQADDAAHSSQMQPESLSLSQNSADLSAVGSTAKQQKQRHSNSHGSNSNQLRLIGAKQQKGGGSLAASTEAIFLTEPQLSPATDYLLSIYASNSKGSSKPIAFTASTTNQSHHLLAGSRDGRRAIAADTSSAAMIGEVLSLSWSPFLIVCAVTVLMCILFAFISVAVVKYVDLSGALSTGGVLNSSNSNNNNGGGAIRSKLNHGGAPASDDDAPPCAKLTLNSSNNLYAATPSRTVAYSSGDSSAASQHSSSLMMEQNCRISNGSNNANMNTANINGQDELTTTTTTVDEYSLSLTNNNNNQYCGADSTSMKSHSSNPYGHLRARVTTIGGGGGHSEAADQELFEEIPLNGIILQRRRDNHRASLLNGSQLKYRLQQQQQHFDANNAAENSQAHASAALVVGRMKQSNSDNFLNQITNNAQFNVNLNGDDSGTLPVTTTFDLSNWLFNTRPALVYNDNSNQGGMTNTAGAYCMGTLPRRNNHHHTHHLGQQQQQNQSVLFAGQDSAAGETNFQQYYEPTIQSNMESPYGKLTATTTTVATNNNSQLLSNGHFAPASQSVSSAGSSLAASPGAQLQLHHHQQQQQQQNLTSMMMLAPPVLNNPAAAACSTDLLRQHHNRAPVEHLVISGKQYIHQTKPLAPNPTAASANSAAPVKSNLMQKQKRHLQLTSGGANQKQRQHLCQQQVVTTTTNDNNNNSGGLQIATQEAAQAAAARKAAQNGATQQFQFQPGNVELVQQQQQQFSNDGNYLALAASTTIEQQSQTNDCRRRQDFEGTPSNNRCLNYAGPATTNDNAVGPERGGVAGQTMEKIMSNSINNRRREQQQLLQNHDHSNSTPRTSDFGDCEDDDDDIELPLTDDNEQSLLNNHHHRQNNLSVGTTMNIQQQQQQQQFNTAAGNRLQPEERRQFSGGDSICNKISAVCTGSFLGGGGGDSSDAISNQSNGTVTTNSQGNTTNGSPSSSGIGPTEFHHHQQQNTSFGGGGGNVVSVLVASSSPPPLNEELHMNNSKAPGSFSILNQRIQRATKKSLTFDLAIEDLSQQTLFDHRQGNNDKNNNSSLATTQFNLSQTANGEQPQQNQQFANLSTCNKNNKAKKNLSTLC